MAAVNKEKEGDFPTDTFIRTKVKKFRHSLRSFKWRVENFFSETPYTLTQELSLPFGRRCFCHLSSSSSFTTFQISSKINLYCELLVSNCHGRILHKWSGYTFDCCTSDRTQSGMKFMDGAEVYEPAYVFEATSVDLNSNLPNNELVIKFNIHREEPQMEVRHCQFERISESPIEYLKKLVDDLEDLSSTDLEERIDICIGGETLSVGKAAICARFPTFNAMLQTDMVEKQKKKVNLEDIDVSVFKMVVTFLLSGVVEDCDFETLCDLYCAADRFNFCELQNACIDLLSDQLTACNVCRVLVMSDKRNDRCLKNIAINYFCLCLEELVTTEDWRTLMLQEPKLASQIINFCYSMKKN